MNSQGIENRLDVSYRALAKANGVSPSVRQLREASGAGQNAVVAYLRSRHEAAVAKDPPQPPEGVVDAVEKSMWANAWEQASAQERHPASVPVRAIRSDDNARVSVIAPRREGRHPLGTYRAFNVCT